MNIKEKFIDLANDFGYEIYENYSGRGMFGKYTIGITCESYDNTINSFKNKLSEYGIELEKDNLGFDMIYYIKEYSILDNECPQSKFEQIQTLIDDADNLLEECSNINLIKCKINAIHEQILDILE